MCKVIVHFVNKIMKQYKKKEVFHQNIKESGRENEKCLPQPTYDSILLRKSKGDSTLTGSDQEKALAKSDVYICD